MFKAINNDYLLDSRLPQKADAQLSDLFFLLYILYLGTLRRIPISKFGINKCIADIYIYLERQNKIDDIKIFNIPLYKHQYGHLNEVIEKKYINELLTTGLVKEGGFHSYLLGDKAFKLMEQYDTNQNEENKKLIEGEMLIFMEKYLKDFDFGLLKGDSHKQKIEDLDGKTKTVHDLPIEKTKAIAYNSSFEDFDKLKIGQVSSIIPTRFLTALSALLEEKDLETVPLDGNFEQDLEKIFA
jgi:hypothetical protein